MVSSLSRTFAGISLAGALAGSISCANIPNEETKRYVPRNNSYCYEKKDVGERFKSYYRREIDYMVIELPCLPEFKTARKD